MEAILPSHSSAMMLSAGAAAEGRQGGARLCQRHYHAGQKYKQYGNGDATPHKYADSSTGDLVAIAICQ